MYKSLGTMVVNFCLANFFERGLCPKKLMSISSKKIDVIIKEMVPKDILHEIPGLNPGHKISRVYLSMYNVLATKGLFEYVLATKLVEKERKKKVLKEFNLFFFYACVQKIFFSFKA